MTDYRTKLYKLGLISRPFTTGMPIIQQKDKTLMQLVTDDIRNLGLKVDISNAINPQNETLKKTLDEITKVSTSIQQNTLNQSLLNQQLEKMNYMESKRFIDKEIVKERNGIDSIIAERDRKRALLEKAITDKASQEDIDAYKSTIETLNLLENEKNEKLKLLVDKAKEYEKTPSPDTTGALKTIPPITFNVKSTSQKVMPKKIDVAINVVNDLKILQGSTDKFTIGRIGLAISNPLKDPLYESDKKVGSTKEFKSGPKRYGFSIIDKPPLSFGTNQITTYTDVDAAAKAILKGSAYDALYNIVISNVQKDEYIKQLTAVITDDYGIPPEWYIYGLTTQ